MSSAKRLIGIAAIALVGMGGTVVPLEAAGALRGKITIDGSSTVYPITEAVAEEFGAEEPNVRVTVGISGTGGGFKRFVVGETDISDASRPIKAKEDALAVEHGITYIEIPVAYDGLTVVVHPKNDFVDKLTPEQLNKLYSDGGGVKTWKDINPAWPDRAVKIYSPGSDSGTYDYFKEVIIGKSGAFRPDMQVSEDDNVLVRGVSGDSDAIGYFGSAYYFENQDKVKAVPIVNLAGNPVLPSIETVKSGDYNPLARPIFIYVNAKSAPRPEVRAFVEFYLDNAADLSREVGYIPLPNEVYSAAERNFKLGKAGSAWIKDGKDIDVNVTHAFK